MFDDLFKMFKPFPPIKVTKRVYSRMLNLEYAYDFEVEYNGDIHQKTYLRYPHIYKNERFWLWDHRREFRGMVKKKYNGRERPTDKDFLI